MVSDDNFGLSKNAIKQFDDLYSLKNETIAQTFERVAKEFATNDEEFTTAYDLLAGGIWRPNTPAFLNAGKPNGKKIFSACYVVGLEDSMDSIYDVANISRKIFQFGAGVGIPIGNLRERDSWIYEGERKDFDDKLVPEGKSSGPITFMKLFDAVGETTKSGGRVRRAAILCSMPIWHPDIEEFIACKEMDGRLSNMNISVAVTDKFMQALEDKVPFSLISPDNGKEVKKVDPVSLWNRLVLMAHKSADPGILFIDTINKWNPLRSTILIESTNPCVSGDTVITTSTGELIITDLSLNDMVLSYNEKSGELEWDEVVNIIKTRENANVIRIELEDDSFIELTPDHKVFTENRGYINASQLTEDDILFSITDEKS